MKLIEFIVLMAVIIGVTWLLGFWGLVGGIVVAILVATGKIKTGFEPKENPKVEERNETQTRRRRKIPRAAKVIGSVMLVILIVVILQASLSLHIPDTNSTSTTSKSPASSVTKTLTPEEQAKKDADNAAAKAKAEAEAKPHFGDGDFIVGTDILAGTYRTRTGSSGCYYSRLSGFGGSIDEIISNENTNAPAVVTIASSDKGFKSKRCGTWTQDLSAITSNQTSFGDGIFIIGTDIVAGTYKSSGGSGCYYSRLSGFGGDMDEIISNENADTSAVVTIASSDKGFNSKGCGTWTKIK